MGVTVRRAGVDDIEEMVRLRLEMQREFRVSGQAARGVPDPEGFVELNRAYFERALPAEGFVAFVAESEGEMVGTSGMVVYEAPPTPGNPSGVEGYILNMYTVPGRRSEGIAGALLERLIEHARSIGARRVWLRTSGMGRRVYERAGFVSDADNLALKLEART